MRWIVLLLLVGCKGSGTSVKGEVTLDGTPVEMGNIVFYPIGSEGRKMSAPIEAGKYAITSEKGAMAGKFKIEITWSRPTGREVPSADPGFTMKETKEAIPAKYNKESMLIEELSSVENVKNYDLKSR